jgi:hypothetical protein
MAILGPDRDRGLFGIYVGESSTSVYIGRDRAIIEVPRNRICAAAIGLTHPVGQARDEGTTMLAALQKHARLLGSSVSDARRCKPQHS